MKDRQTRRSFFKKSVAASLALPAITSLEEYALVAQEGPGTGSASAAQPVAVMPRGRIGSVTMSRLICGGNLISGYAHSRDLIYVSHLLQAYFTEAKIMETWAKCEAQGIDTMIFNPSDRRALEIYRKYRAQGGRIQCLAQVGPDDGDPGRCVKEAVDAGAVGVLLVGNLGDAWTREGKMDRVADFLGRVKAERVLAGVAGHELRTPRAVEQAGLKPDFYMKTYHSDHYWSKRQPDQMKEIIDNYGVDNYWCLDPEGTVRFFQEIERPWIAYKVLAAGAIHPRAGFKRAFENGADFCVVGMFDFQIEENVRIASQAVREAQNRERSWYA